MSLLDSYFVGVTNKCLFPSVFSISLSEPNVSNFISLAGAYACTMSLPTRSITQLKPSLQYTDPNLLSAHTNIRTLAAQGTHCRFRVANQVEFDLKCTLKSDGQCLHYGNVQCSSVKLIGLSLLIKSLKFANEKKCCKFSIGIKTEEKKFWLNPKLQDVFFFRFSEWHSNLQITLTFVQQSC